MPPSLDFSGNRLWLHEDCIYIQLGEKDSKDDLIPEQKAVVFKHTHPQTHFTPENDSARLILDLLTQDQHQGVSFKDITDNLLENFQLGSPDDAKDYLNEFLNELNSAKLLGYDNNPPVHVGILKEYKGRKKPERAPKGKIKHGGTIICCGYTVTRYRP
jgi:hypothetical protein